MTEGFFSKKEVESTPTPKGKPLSCTGCGLYKDCTTPRMKPLGNFKKGILNIEIMPSQTEDKNGGMFQGKTGRVLASIYKKLGVDLFEDCLSTSAIQCHSTAYPTNYQLDCCRRRIMRVIEENKPKVIILFGLPAVYSVIGGRWKKDLGTIVKWRGWTIPDQTLNAWVCPTSTIDYILKNEKGAERTIFNNDLRQALALASIPFPKYKEPTIEVIEDLSVLSTIKEVFAFDYETTGIKPHTQGHRIVCCAIADTPDHAYVFMMPKTRKELKPLIDLLGNENIPKVAQNMKFEHKWSDVRLGVEVKGWEWDTMLATHILDNRSGITSLKFQTYIQFGIVDYSSEVDPYLKSSDGNSSNDFNKILDLIETEEGRRALMKYCALDAIYEMRLYKRQSTEIVLPF